MHHSTSGKAGYDVYNTRAEVVPNHRYGCRNECFSTDLLREILQTENRLRCEKDWQTKFAEVDSNRHWEEVARFLQEAAIREHWERVCETLKPVLCTEGSQRKSDVCAAFCTEAKETPDEAKMMEIALHQLRSIRGTMASEFADGNLPKPVYVKHDRSRNGDFRVGDLCPDNIPGSVLPLDGGDGFTSMWAFMDSLLETAEVAGAKPTKEVVVLIAGSIT